MKARGPDGRRWRVRRVWLRWDLGSLNPVEASRADPFGGLLVLPFALLAQILLVPFVMAWKAVTHRSIQVEATTSDLPIDAQAWKVTGVRSSGRVAQAICAAIAAGGDLDMPGARPVPYGLD